MTKEKYIEARDKYESIQKEKDKTLDEYNKCRKGVKVAKKLLDKYFELEQKEAVALEDAMEIRKQWKENYENRKCAK